MSSVSTKFFWSPSGQRSGRVGLCSGGMAVGMFFGMLLAASPGGWAAGITPEQRAFFENKIRPVLVKECYECHSEDSKKLGGRLKLDTHLGMLKGGESGPVMQPGKPDKSVLIQAIQYDGSEMPPKKKLPDPVIRDFVEWVKMGAPDPRGEEKPSPSKAGESRRKVDLWSLQPVVEPPVPTGKDGADWAKDPLDRLVWEKMRAGGLEPAADADPGALIRRLSVDLNGLPPTAEQSEQFVSEFRVEGRRAVERWVDRLLASPQYGERWGRHWLDVARFAESNGDDGLGRNPNFPHAWRYRDYVIDAFNRDVPYDEFLREQIAGDLMEDGPGPERDRRLVATGFLAVGFKPCVAMNNNFAMDVVADQIGLIGSGVMGLSVGCARCHDHKHDPITLRDYTALAGIFKSTETLWGAAGYEGLSAPQTPLHELRSAPWVAVPPAEQLPKPIRVEQKRPSSGKFDPKPGAPVAMGAREAVQIADCRVHIGGESGRLGDSVPRGVPGLFRTEAFSSVDLCPPRSGRMELVDWLVGEAMPLTARVMVNRVWQHLFEDGLVRTPDDFGVYGDQPVQRELLDHLAARFVREGWSVKRLVRAVVLSRTYQMGSVRSEAAGLKDPENRLLSFHPRRRMDGEALRDAMLAASGELKLDRPAGSLLQHQNVLVNEMGNLHRPNGHRSVYQLMLRGAMPPELSAFNEPDALKVKGKRDVSTVPTQFLFLLNNPFVIEQSRRFAERVLEGGVDDREAARRAFRRALSRNPSETEREQVLGFVADMHRELEGTEADPGRRRMEAWAMLCQSLLASNPMRYVD